MTLPRLAAALVVAVFALTGCGTATTTGSPSVSASGVAAAGDTRPLAVTIPAIGAASDLVATGKLPDGSLATPPVEQPEQASWWDGSGHPGEAGRPVVILGHVDGAGRPGVFARLDELRPEDTVWIDRRDGTRLRYEVYDVSRYAKASFPTEKVYRDTATSDLRLITCGGAFDHSTGHYRDNVVAYARIAS